MRAMVSKLTPEGCPGWVSTVTRKMPPAKLATLMKISDPLAQLNAERFASWSKKFSTKNARQAVLAFDGDVYDGLQARSLAAADLEWAQSHVAILSGLYGVLRPLDRMQPYRLEMGTSLTVGAAGNLYQFWGSRIADSLLGLEFDSRCWVARLGVQRQSTGVTEEVTRLLLQVELTGLSRSRASPLRSGSSISPLSPSLSISM